MNMSKQFLQGTNPFMAISSAVLVLLFLGIILVNPGVAENLYGNLQVSIARHLSGYLFWVVTFVMLSLLLLAISPFGKVVLGKDGESPEFNRFSWFAMLLSAGVGTGILFWGVAEPMFHLQANPFLLRDNIEPMTAEASVVAQRITLFHWGLHGWCIYSMVGLCLGYFSFRKGLPLSIRSALHPFLGDRIYGPIGHAVDLLAIFSTLFGVAISLGLGASQLASGFNYLFGWSDSPMAKLIIILVVSAIATFSAVLGVNRGIRRLSEMNIWLSLVLMLFLILSGPTLLIIASYFTGTADYIMTFFPMGVWVNPDRLDGWQAAWTIFYWGWWIAWGPFVGMFMARVSRGRSLREYILGTLIIPALAGFLALVVFGAIALDLQLQGPGTLVDAVNTDMTQALYTTFELLNVEWATWGISLLTTVLIVTWFVTSSDSATLVISTIITIGNTQPPRRLRIFWGIGIALVAGLLLLGGGLKALQAASTAIAVPFSVVLILMVFGLLKALWQSERGQDST